MKKTAYILATAVLVATMAGCNSNSGDAQTTTNKDGAGVVTQVAVPEIQKNDTTDEAIAYLRTQVPLFAKYAEKRNSVPLTYEVEITSGDVTQTASIHIKDDKNISFISTNADGVREATIYKDNVCYVISDEEKTLYSSEVTTETSKSVVEQNLMPIKIEEAKGMSYSADTAEYDGVTYKRETIGENNYYYFDEATEELRYIIIGDNAQVTKITRFENVCDESAFELPEGYKSVDLNEYVNDTLNAEKEAAAAEAEAAGTVSE